MTQTLVYVPNNFFYKDLFIHNYGIEYCYPSHYHGPDTRECYLIHFVIEGEGTFKVGNKTHYIKKGEAFLIKPGVVTYYKADHSNPWTYCWIAFHGIQAENIINETNLTMESPVFSYDQNEMFFQEFLSCIDQEYNNTEDELKIHGLLFLLLSTLVGEYPKQKTIRRLIKKEEYIHTVIDYIEAHYASKISIASIAEYIGLDRSYLSSLFKEYLNSSIQEYLIQYRLNKACSFLSNSDLSIGDISRSVGYEDPLLFSKMFKKYKGVSPKHYRLESYSTLINLTN
ncbi:AraC family transcriptional regulator [Bacillus sp. FJAT-49732]|uniref:AraC family transcriptional regulator n=1 Tax=Lederbergia citrisecunda TaxID=2833583 RepID=A0A942YNQ5_9BACI|nr:AraC family transcriptional regulator [Lederbergia citrisecunda]MBS4201965.1 AraC family transcriptional regulator [Lederbergia citrisecunda]